MKPRSFPRFLHQSPILVSFAFSVLCSTLFILPFVPKYYRPYSSPNLLMSLSILGSQFKQQGFWILDVMQGASTVYFQLRVSPFCGRRFRGLVAARRTSPVDTLGTLVSPCNAGSADASSESPPSFPQSALEPPEDASRISDFRKKRLLRRLEVKKEREIYRLIAFAASSFLAGLASFATYFKFFFMKPKGTPFPWYNFAATLLLVFTGTAGMEMYARWAHKKWWHDTPSGWALHKSHHEPRTGPFEANDIYAVANALPAFALCYIGFFQHSILGCLCFGLGLGITLFGMAYMFVHDGLVHRRFPVGPLADLPIMKKVAAAHMIHHADKYGGLPFGMFLGPQEIAHIPEAVDEMNRLAATLGKQ